MWGNSLLGLWTGSYPHKSGVGPIARPTWYIHIRRVTMNLIKRSGEGAAVVGHNAALFIRHSIVRHPQAAAGDSAVAAVQLQLTSLYLRHET